VPGPHHNLGALLTSNEERFSHKTLRGSKTKDSHRKTERYCC
jgi:hypothetical protein